jgi:orotate phosphoribosyltransferase
MSNLLAKEVNAIARLEGSFVLRSGQGASHYLDNCRFEAEPTPLGRAARAG